MRKRGGLARAMALDPQILFFDEPSAGLDPVNTAELETLIRGINAGLGTTMVIVSHQVELVLRIADRIIMLDREEKGIIAAGTPEELRLSANDPRVRNFLFRGSGTGERVSEMAKRQSRFMIGLFVIVGVMIGVAAIVWLGAANYFEKGAALCDLF